MSLAPVLSDMLPPSQQENTHLPEKTVFVLSDSTGITAETFSHAILCQFTHAYRFKQVRKPFIETEADLQKILIEINHLAETEGPPIIFSTLVSPTFVERIRNCNGIFLDIFSACVKTLELSLDVDAKAKVGISYASDPNSNAYHKRIEAINFTLQHDDGESVEGLQASDLILVGVSRSGKTPSSLYMAMQYGLKVANYPLTPDDFQRGRLPNAIKDVKHKLFGLTIDPDRLAAIRQERRPDSTYATLASCQAEVKSAESMMRLNGIPFLSTTTKSIEEIATMVLKKLGLPHMHFK